MSALWTSTEIAAATDGKASVSFDVSGVAFDSREVGPGDLFIAMTGEMTDGHRFVDQAMGQGAAAVLVSAPVSHPQVLVSDTTAALNALGAASRARTSAKIIGVTGSVGKTGTKEALAAALARAHRSSVHRSVKSYNNHTGVPLSLARMPRESGYGVFEMGMNHAGELAALTQLVRPHVALVTAIASAHREFFESEAAIADAKGEIFQGLEPGGTAILPFDSPHYARLRKAAEPYAAHILTFGRAEGADVRVLDEMPLAFGSKVTAQLPEAELSFTLSQSGAHWVSNAMAVLAAVHALGGDLAAAGLALADLEDIAGRGARKQIPVGDGKALLIDESYNANPASMAATLMVLGDLHGRRKIAVLGAMRELGADSDALHAGLAAQVMAANTDFALLVGSGMEPLAKALEGKTECVHVADAAAALEVVRSLIRAGDTVLIKGSNSIGLSRVVAGLADGVA